MSEKEQKTTEMSEKEQKTPEGLTGSENEQVYLDERRFLRRVRWRSALRTILIALGVVVVSYVLLFV